MSEDCAESPEKIERATLERALDVWGIDAQFEQATEECAELIVELQGGNANDLVEEIADVQIMLEQLKLVVGEDRVSTKVNDKMARLRDRLDAAEEVPQEADSDE